MNRAGTGHEHPRFDHLFALRVVELPAQAPTGAARRKSERAILGRTATLLRTDHPENPRTEGVHVLFRASGARGKVAGKAASGGDGSHRFRAWRSPAVGEGRDGLKCPNYDS